MAPSVSIDLSGSERSTLLHTARDSLESGLSHGCAIAVDPTHHEGVLCETLGVFVTLNRNRRLRGCIGRMESTEPLLCAVADSAYSAGFQDPRFSPLRRDEVDELSVEISVLSPLEAIPAASRQSLLAQLQPGVDGLLLEDGRHRATFLPKVWEQLPAPVQFLEHLLAKAGLAPDHWSSTTRVSRYTTLSFSDTDTTAQ